MNFSIASLDLNYFRYILVTKKRTMINYTLDINHFAYASHFTIRFFISLWQGIFWDFFFLAWVLKKKNEFFLDPLPNQKIFINFIEVSKDSLSETRIVSLINYRRHISIRLLWSYMKTRTAIDNNFPYLHLIRDAQELFYLKKKNPECLRERDRYHPTPISNFNFA